MFDDLFTDYVADSQTLLAYGFVQKDASYHFEKKLSGGDFLLKVKIEGSLSFKVWDLDLDEELFQFYQEARGGTFLADLRQEVVEVLLDIRQSCFQKEVFQSSQAQQVLDYLEENYQIKPSFLWSKNPHTAALRHREALKWLGVIMVIDWSKLNPSRSGRVEVLNLKSDQVDALLKDPHIYPAYHMNKKYWISLPLDGLLDMDKILQLLEQSYQLTK